ncbi:MAG: electron transfer flavoprotein subunit alpha/FixB family protein [Actinomycetaceae bacterium]|nr:electron transfer flavoprotein subunit alpha/FixB family protein [Actinomycetaceae bacterium]
MEQLSTPILVITDHSGNLDDGFVLTNPSKQLLTLARTLTNGRIDAVALNPAPDTQALGAYGVNRVFTPDLTGVSPRVPAIVAECGFAAARQDLTYCAVLNVSNYRGRDVAAALAMLLGSGAAVDVTDCHIANGGIEAKKSVLAGSWITSFQVTRGTPVVALRPSSVEAVPVAEPTNPEVIALDVDFSDSARAIEVLESVPQEGTGRVSLAEAPVVVCGGRGTDGDFTQVEELADQLGGAVGATRVACDEGWIDRTAQIGQTGVTVAPNLYIGLGVSGAVHHACGIQASDHIAAVVDDPDAPIVELADFVVIGDINEVVPAALEELQSIRSAND